MKRIISLILVFCLALGLCACGGSGSGEEKKEGLQVGYAKVDITPNFPVGMGGYSDYATRRVSGFITYIYTTCIAVTEGEETVLVYTVDIGGLNGGAQDDLRTAITNAIAIPADHIFIGATHTHSAPSYTAADSDGVKYQNLLKAAMVEAGQKALADQSAATINAAQPIVEGYNFVRHYEVTTGEVAGPNFGPAYDKTNVVRHMEEPDREMVLVQFDRGEDKKDILMVNWQAHAASGKNEIDYNSVCADFVGPLRDKVEAETGMLVAYFTGAGGDTVQESLITSHSLKWRDYGEKVAEFAIEGCKDLKPVEGSGINTTYVEYQAPVDHSWDHMLPQANEVFDLWQSMGKTAGDALGDTYGFSSVYQAKLIRYRSDMGQYTPLQLRAFHIGGVGFAVNTYEMSGIHAKSVKANDPFPVTFIITGNSTYAPTSASYDYRAYEADTSYYAKGTGEAMAEKLTEMLKEIAPSA